MMTVREHMALRLAATPYKHPAIRATHARELLGYNEIQLWAVVTSLLERADAEASHPVEVRRLRRISQRRAEARSARRLTSHSSP